MQTVLLDLDRFGGAVVRVVPVPRMKPDKVTPQVTPDGEVIYMGLMLVPGVAESLYRDPTVGQVRLRMFGSVPEGLAEFQPVRLTGLVKVSSWFGRSRARGQDDSAGITITAEGVEPIIGAFPDLSGLLPVRPTSDDPFLALEAKPAPNDNPGFDVLLGLPGSIPDFDSGKTTVRVTQRPADSLVGRPVRFEGLTAKLVAPPGEDVSRSTKASIALFAQALVAVELEAATVPARRRDTVAPEVPVTAGEQP